MDSINEKRLLKSILIANRGEIAVRVARTLKKLGIRSVGIYSEIDRHSEHVNVVDCAIQLNSDQPSLVYLRSDLIIEAALKENVDGIFPAYGFLSENVQFAMDCEKNGLIFIGPTTEQIGQFGLKHVACEIAFKANVPLLERSNLLENIEEAKKACELIGYPVMLKSTAGGGGNGLEKCSNEFELIDLFDKVRRTSEKYYGNKDVYLERYVKNGRHIEVQIFGDGIGNVIALGERDCSIQRRNQKIIEETPPPFIHENILKKIRQSAIDLAKFVNYRSIGTVEFIFDEDNDKYYFIEVNCRLQVEHGITECLYGIDLVQWMIQLENNCLSFQFNEEFKSNGVSIEVRICSEEPLNDYRPCCGMIYEVLFPNENVRVDTWISNGIEISHFYDSLLAKIIVHGNDRHQAIQYMIHALENTRLIGINTNLNLVREIFKSKSFVNGEISLNYLKMFDYKANCVEVIESGTYTTIQDYPGRIGYWDIGVPPSGPMDDFAFRLGNRLVGNNESAAGIECTLIGGTLKFHHPMTIAITGGEIQPKLNKKEIVMWKSIDVCRGDILEIGRVKRGCRTYVCIRGGIDVPVYLGSRSTFVLGQFGGYAGRTLKCGDVLYIGECNDRNVTYEIIDELIPRYPNVEEGEEWQIGVMYGPHGAPEFFQQDFIEKFFSTSWKVHYNSNRLGVRLIGEKPLWARRDGGEAGLHPSNIHDCEYAIGTINFTGDTPIILTQDGPSLGGFVCPVTIVKAEIWKIGQIKPNDQIRFYPMKFEQAVQLEIDQNKSLLNLISFKRNFSFEKYSKEKYKSILYEYQPNDEHPKVVYRQAGDHYILIEYGPSEFNLANRVRVHYLIEELRQKNPIEGICEYSPGVRSLQIRYDSLIIHQNQVLSALLAAEQRLPTDENLFRISSRIVSLPLAFEDSSTLDAVQRYQQTIKQSAPWLPNNVDFIQRINGLPSRDDVKQIIYSSSYLVIGLGDVYLGAPCAIPIDPRHRLLTSKYNPARTFTPEGTVGIGGVYMCIYGMDSPDGYQLIGRTLPIWNTFHHSQPCLLTFFDQVRFYPVDQHQLSIQRQLFKQGKFQINIIEDNYFHLGEYRQFLEDNSQSIELFRRNQSLAFDQEVSHWQNHYEDHQQQQQQSLFDHHLQTNSIPDDHHQFVNVHSEICGSIWKILVQIDQTVQFDAPLLILEAMKMEITVRSPIQGTISSILCHPGQFVDIKDVLFQIKHL